MVEKKRSPRTAGVFLKRAYDAPDAQDGTRVLVDRLWPRVLKKETAAVDRWLKEIAPSTDLRHEAITVEPTVLQAGRADPSWRGGLP